MTTLSEAGVLKLEQLKKEITEKRDQYSEHEAVFVFGPMGSGKTTFMKENLLNGNQVWISIDDYFSDLCTPDFAVEDIYYQCREVGRLFTDWLLDAGISMLMEGTGQNTDVFDFMIRLKKAGYRVISYFVHTPLELCLERVRARNKTTERKIALRAVSTAYKRLWEMNLEKLVELSDEVHDYNITVANLFNTTDLVLYDQKIDELEAKNDFEMASAIEKEVQLFQSSTAYAEKHGGEMTNSILRVLKEIIPEKYPHLRLDVRSSMLAPGWYGSIPGWHCDFVSRDEKGKIMPDAEADAQVLHYLLITGEPMTEFLRERKITIAKETVDWNIVDQQIREMKLTSFEIPEKRLVCFTGNELHRATPASHPSGMRWRLLFRASYFPKGHPARERYANKIRTQSQVYVDLNAPGW